MKLLILTVLCVLTMNAMCTEKVYTSELLSTKIQPSKNPSAGIWRINLTETRGNLAAAIAKRCPQTVFISDPNDTKLYNLQFYGTATCDELINAVKLIKNEELESQGIITVRPEK